MSSDLIVKFKRAILAAQSKGVDIAPMIDALRAMENRGNCTRDNIIRLAEWFEAMASDGVAWTTPEGIWAAKVCRDAAKELEL